MFLAHSRTSIFAGLIATIVALRFLGRRTLVLVALIAVPLTWVFSEVLIRFMSRGQSKEVFMSMSGRTQFWEGVWARFLIPVFGHGL